MRRTADFIFLSVFVEDAPETTLGFAVYFWESFEGRDLGRHVFSFFSFLFNNGFAFAFLGERGLAS